jgi:tetratricopeptide (TPR) repeat protein
MPPRPDTPDPGVDEGLERILEDVYRTMLGRNLYQILGTTPDSPLSAIRDAASRLLHKYGPAQYRSFMLSERARKLLDLVCAEIQRARDVLTDLQERLAYDRHMEIAYSPGLRAHMETLFEAEALFETGREAMKAKEFERAADLFEKANLLNPREPEYVAVAGWSIYQSYAAGTVTREESLPKAHAAIQRALAVDPRHQRSMLFLARIHRELNEREEALDWYERLLKIDPTNEEASVWIRELKPWVESRRRSAAATSSWARFTGLFKRK